MSVARYCEEHCGIFQRCPGLLELILEMPNANSMLENALMHCPLLTAIKVTPVSAAGVRAITASGVQLKRLELGFSSLDDSALVP